MDKIITLRRSSLPCPPKPRRRRVQTRRAILTERVSQILHYDWDPIGIAGIPEARDEYDSYVTPIVQLLLKGQGRTAIAAHLDRLERELMGLTVGSQPSHRTQHAAALICTCVFLGATRRLPGFQL
jgi:hypothetical protein